MKNIRYFTYALILFLSVFGPYTYVSKVIGHSMVEDTAEAKDEYLKDFGLTKSDLLAQAKENQNKIAVCTHRSSDLSETLKRAEAELEQKVPVYVGLKGDADRVNSLQETLSGEVMRKFDAVALLRTRLLVSAAKNGFLQTEVNRMGNRLSGIEEEISTATGTSLDLEMERISWERDESINSIPRSSIVGIVGGIDEELYTGVGFDLRLFRPLKQNLGLKFCWLVNEDQIKSYSQAGIAWRKLFAKQLHVDFLLGVSSLGPTDKSVSNLEPTVGTVMGFTLPKIRIGAGLMAAISPETSVIGIWAGYSDTGRIKAVY